MAIKTVDNLILDASSDILDPGKTRWTDADWLRYIDRGYRAIMNYRPDAFTSVVGMSLVPGVKQTLLATDGSRFLKILRNVTSPETSNPVFVNFDYIRDLSEYWSGDAANAVVKEFSFDIADPRTFYVYPAQPAAGMGTVEIQVTRPPVDAALGGALDLPDNYYDALLNYIMFLAYARDYDQKKMEHFKIYQTLMGVKTQSDSVVTPTEATT